MKLRLIISILLFVALGQANAQQLSKAEARYEIDVKRIGLNPSDREALFRSREFIRLDPTYYVGYFYEALFKYDRISDYIGFRNVVPVLKKALSLLEKDFAAELSVQYTSREDHGAVEQIRMDYTQLSYALMDSYSNLEQPDSVMMFLDHYQKWNFQRELLDANNYKAWTVHRNRFYTSEKYPFLKKSIEENEKLALTYLYKSKAKIEKYRELNVSVFGPMWVLGDELGVAHYAAIVHSYLRNIDSAEYYYNQMRGYNIFPYNNYGIFRYVNGDFAEASYWFNMDLWRGHGDKRVQEAEVYFGTLSVFKSEPYKSIVNLKNSIKEKGIVPGWGWYNIALARSYLYNGQLDKCNEHLKKAKDFKEVHIGTTWGQSHYDTSIAALELMAKEREQAAIKFENKGYWYSPSKLLKLAQLSIEKDAQQLLLLNRLASNPEREEVFYSIFASENTVSFDEIWYMLKDYGQKFFLKRFQEQGQADERLAVRKYFKLFAAKLMLERGDKKDALEALIRIEKEETIDPEYEKLFQARLVEARVLCNGSENDLSKLYEVYPQLIPFSSLTMKFKLEVYDDDGTQSRSKVQKELKRYNIDWVDEVDRNTPRAIVYFSNDGKNDIITYSVKLRRRDIIEEKTIVCKSPEDAARQLVYGLFKVSEPDSSESYDYY
ncbi:MAG: hypothetical protein LBG19_11000 [Prevotellaceae bacterium]|jgi:hypothetical protein|nr:hypothetical protein [Prevotellaceae bacterium]